MNVDGDVCCEMLGRTSRGYDDAWRYHTAADPFASVTIQGYFIEGFIPQ